MSGIWGKGSVLDSVGLSLTRFAPRITFEHDREDDNLEQAERKVAVDERGKALLVLILLLENPAKAASSARNLAGAWIYSRAGSNSATVQGPFSDLGAVCFASCTGLLTTSRNTVTSDIPSFANKCFFLACYLLPGTFLIHLFAFKLLSPPLCLRCLTYP